MYGERHNELVRTIGGLLLEMLPDGAERIVATGDVDEDGAVSSLRYHFPSGESGGFSIDAMPPQQAELNRVLIDFREDMLADGSDPWFGYTITVHRNGDFDVDLSYDELT